MGKYKKYEVWRNGKLEGETIAVSSKQAVNNVRFKNYGRTKTNQGFKAKEVEERNHD